MNDLFYLGVKAVIKNADGQVLLLKAKDYWDLPGGRTQLGETELDALRREITEETGISITEVTSHLGMSLSNVRLPLPAADTAGLIFSVYACEVSNHAVVISDEHIDFDWVSPGQAAELLVTKYPQELCKVIAAL